MPSIQLCISEPTLKKSYRKFTEDVSVIGVTQVILAFKPIILLALLTKSLGAHDYGIWAQVQVTIGLTLAFVSLGLGFAMVRLLPAKTSKEEIQEDFYSVFSLTFLATLIASIALIAGADVIARAFFENATQIVRITGLIVLVWSLDSVSITLFRVFRQMKTHSILMIGDAYGQIGLIAYLVLNGYGLFSMVVAILVVRVLLLVIVFFLIIRQIGIRRPRFTRIREYFSFGIFVVPSHMCTWLVNSSDRYIIGYFLGMASVGIYTAAYQVGNILTMVGAVLGFVLAPTLSKLYDEDNIYETKEHLRYSMKYFLALAIPFVFGSAVLAKPLLSLISTPEIASQGRFILPIVALSILIFGLCAIVPYGLLLQKRVRLSATIWIIAAICNISLNILIVPRIGILGAALTTLIAYSIVLGLATYYSWREFSFGIEWMFIAKSIIASVVMSLVVWSVSAEGSLITILTVIGGALIYAITLLALKGFSREEIAFFKGLFRKT